MEVEKDEWMDGWWSPGMGQLQVAVAGLGEGGLVAGHAGRPGHRVPGHLGAWARTRHKDKVREEAAAVVTVG